MNTRVVTFFSTKGGKHKLEIENNKTWNDLLPFANENYDMSNLQATENVNKTTLTHPDAKVPDGDIVIFLRPVRTKSGMEGTERKSFRELRALVVNDNIKEHLNNTFDKNWTHLTTEELRTGLASYEESNNNSSNEPSKDLGEEDIIPSKDLGEDEKDFLIAAIKIKKVKEQLTMVSNFLVSKIIEANLGNIEEFIKRNKEVGSDKETEKPVEDEVSEEDKKLMEEFDKLQEELGDEV